jgi:hypothetical protein
MRENSSFGSHLVGSVGGKSGSTKVKMTKKTVKVDALGGSRLLALPASTTYGTSFAAFNSGLVRSVAFHASMVGAQTAHPCQVCPAILSLALRY